MLEKNKEMFLKIILSIFDFFEKKQSLSMKISMKLRFPKS